MQIANDTFLTESLLEPTQDSGMKDEGLRSELVWAAPQMKVLEVAPHTKSGTDTVIESSNGIYS